MAKDVVDAHAVANAQEGRHGGQCASRSRDKCNCRTSIAARRGLDVARDAPDCAAARIAPCVENWDRMHRPMEMSVLGVCERSDIVAVTKSASA